MRESRGMSVLGVDANGRTALHRACADGDLLLLEKLLLDPTVDIALEDYGGMSPLEHALRGGHHPCAALLRSEAHYRATTPQHPYHEHLRAELNVADGAAFSERLFRQALGSDPAAALRYLDQFVNSDGRYNLTFKDLDAIYGKYHIKSSALYSVLNGHILAYEDDEKLSVLRHVVLQRILDVKWELFGARKYYQHVLLFVAMLMAMTMVVMSVFAFKRIDELKTLDRNDTAYQAAEKRALRIEVSFVVWVVFLVFGAVASLHLHYFEPMTFARLTRRMYDGMDILEPSFMIPNVVFYKAKAKTWLLHRVLLWTLLVATPVVLVLTLAIPSAGEAVVEAIVLFNLYFTLAVLFGCAVYFLLLEYREVLGEDPWIFERIEASGGLRKAVWILVLVLVLPFMTPFLPTYRRYYASHVNKLQLLTHLCVIFVFTPMHFWRLCAPLSPGLKEVYLCLGAFLTLSLWMLSLQFLEVNRTAGYLLPMVKDVMGDVWDFTIFYGVFQCGLTCAFYFIFQQESDAYKTLWASFRTTYFVLYGDNGGDDFTLKDNDGKHVLPDVLLHFGLILRMFHCAVMVVLLLNLLLAMMNKTVDGNWDKLQARALSSYARCVLRLEIALGQTQAEREQLLHFALPSGRVRNPIFDEPVSKQELAQQDYARGNDDADESPDDKIATLQATVDHLVSVVESMRQRLETSNH